MAAGISKTITTQQEAYIGGVGTSGLYLKMDISETYDEATNTSSLRFHNLKMKEYRGAIPYGNAGYLDGQILLKIGGETYSTVMNANAFSPADIFVNASDSDYMPVKKQSGSTYADWEVTVNNIQHKDDGSLNVTIQIVNLTLYFKTGSSQIHDIKLNYSETIALTVISRGSKVYIDDGTGYRPYYVYIDTGTWVKYNVYIDTGTWTKY